LRNRRILALPVLALAFSLIGMTPALAHDHTTPADHDHNPTAGLGPPAAGAPADPNRATSRPLFLTARLSGRQEVPVAGGPAVGDPDGSATAVLRVQGNRVTFALSWRGIGTPTLGHIHQGAAGVNGAVKVLFFGTPMPDTATAAAGAVTVDDPAIADAIRANPRGFYVNLHSAQFPGGAVRGQLAPVGRRVDLLSAVRAGPFRAFLAGDQEVPVAGGPAVGDPDGRAVAFVRPAGGGVEYSLAWVGVTPTLGHIHQGRFGVNGPVVVPLFTTAVPSSIVALSGRVSTVDATVLAQLRRKPGDFYANLHTAEFPGGGVRGQLFH
jgi:hypothetical protein